MVKVSAGAVSVAVIDAVFVEAVIVDVIDAVSAADGVFEGVSIVYAAVAEPAAEVADAEKAGGIAVAVSAAGCAGDVGLLFFLLQAVSPDMSKSAARMKTSIYLFIVSPKKF
jgi:hypothetical protein